MKKNLIEEVDLDQDSEEGEESEMVSFRKLDFEGVDEVFNALIFAFHPNGLEGEEEPDPRFHASWQSFLVTAGWSEDEFWEVSHEHDSHCPHCGSPGIPIAEEEAKAKKDPSKDSN